MFSRQMNSNLQIFLYVPFYYSITYRLKKTDRKVEQFKTFGYKIVYLNLLHKNIKYSCHNSFFFNSPHFHRDIGIYYNTQFICSNVNS